MKLINKLPFVYFIWLFLSLIIATVSVVIHTDLAMGLAAIIIIASAFAIYFYFKNNFTK
jgi:anaerobic C4-dicarboxylate transporter